MTRTGAVQMAVSQNTESGCGAVRREGRGTPTHTHTHTVNCLTGVRPVWGPFNTPAETIEYWNLCSAICSTLARGDESRLGKIVKTVKNCVKMQQEIAEANAFSFMSWFYLCVAEPCYILHTWYSRMPYILCTIYSIGYIACLLYLSAIAQHRQNALVAVSQTEQQCNRLLDLFN